MTVLLVFGLFVVIATAHNITHLEVPRYGDPRAPAALGCHYVSEKGDPPLHSVKWYRGNDEIFRYTPGQQCGQITTAIYEKGRRGAPEAMPCVQRWVRQIQKTCDSLKRDQPDWPCNQPTTRTFNTSMGGGVTGSCNQHSCSITVRLPQTYNARASFTCEVSTEGPRFAVVKQTKNLTVAVVLKEDPVILGVPGSVQFGEDVLLNCTTAPAMPPANIMWFIDGKPERTEPWLVNNTQVSAANERGLRSSWRALRVRVASPKGYLGLRCEATQPTWPPFVRMANATIMVARSPHLSMFTASGCWMMERNGWLTAASLMVVHIFSKYSALSEIASKSI